MTYSYTRASIINVEPYLVELLNSKSESIEFITLRPDNLSYKIRQGIKAACELDDKVYSKLDGLYTIKMLPGKVACIKNVDVTPIINDRQVESHSTFVDVTTILGVLEKVIEDKLSTTLTFPNYNPDEEECKKLILLCDGYKLALTVQNSQLILTRME